MMVSASPFRIGAKIPDKGWVVSLSTSVDKCYRNEDEPQDGSSCLVAELAHNDWVQINPISFARSFIKLVVPLILVKNYNIRHRAEPNGIVL